MLLLDGKKLVLPFQGGIFFGWLATCQLVALLVGLGGFAGKCYAPVWCFAHTLGTALRFARRPAPASVPPRKVGAAVSPACLKRGSGAQSRFQADPRRSNKMMFASFHATISCLV